MHQRTEIAAELHCRVSSVLPQSVFGLPIGALLAPVAICCAELFPANVRSVVSGIGSCLAAGLIGGATSLIGTARVGATGLGVAPATYVTLLAVIGVIEGSLLAPESIRLAFGTKEVAPITDLSASAKTGRG